LAKEKIVGIIAEYNPFHKGHLYHMKRSLETTGAAAAVIVLSSSFVQRGEPAFIDKWSRAEMAISCGASLAIELPVAFSCHNAGVFGSAAVDLLFSSGIVTHVSFGMENPEAPLEEIADILIREPDDFRAVLRDHLDLGFSYAQSRSNAIEASIPGAGRLISSPNNTLAQEYVLRIREMEYPLETAPVKRIGEGYHGGASGGTASASWIRDTVRREGLSRQAREVMPSVAAEILEREISRGRCLMSLDVFWRILRTVILRDGSSRLSRHAEMREGIENLLLSNALRARSFDEFTRLCTSKRYPRSKIQRFASHVLMGFDHRSNRKAQRLGPPYIRVLGWDQKGQDLLRQMRTASRLPVIFCPKGRKGSYQRMVADLEYRASGIWENLVPSTDMLKESGALPVRPGENPAPGETSL
jgi:predicted nucleotidyltransferase